jgi:hypothetical protein
MDGRSEVDSRLVSPSNLPAAIRTEGIQTMNENETTRKYPPIKRQKSIEELELQDLKAIEFFLNQAKIAEERIERRRNSK